MKRFSPLLLLLALLFCLTANAATKLDSLRQNYSRFSRLYPQERVYLHFDNTSYYKGERIWFAAMVVKGAAMTPTDMSRVLYVELLNPLGFPVETQKLKLHDGMANGSFVLKDTLNAGYYEVRAYTAWMLNFAPAYDLGQLTLYERDLRRLYSQRFIHYIRGNAGVFSRVFPIYNNVEQGQYEQRRLVEPGHVGRQADDEALGVNFYPEGGRRLVGHSWRVAFECKTAEGRFADAEGQLTSGGKSVGRFSTLHDGRGVVDLPADADGRIDLVVKGRVVATIPAAESKGYGLRVDRNANGQTTMISVCRTARTDGARLGLLVSCRGEESLYREIDLTGTNTQAGISVSSGELPTGVNIATLFNNQGKVIAQREFFVLNHQDDGLSIAANGNTSQLRSYDKVNLTLQLHDAKGNRVKRAERFSLAVTDRATREPSYYRTSVLSSMLLSSEVRGFIPNADYYFERDDRQHRDALDHLLMVQGWTRYNQEQMLSGQTWQPRFAVEKGLAFHGRVMDNNNTQLMSLWRKPQREMFIYADFIGHADLDDEDADKMATLVTPQDKTELQNYQQELKPDEEGYFDIQMPDFSGKGLLFMMLNRYSSRTLGRWRAMQPGHSVGYYSRRDTLLEVNNSIFTLNAVSPVAKTYNYYETAPLSVRRYGTDLPLGQPTFVMDVNDMLTYSSGITGLVEPFSVMPSGLRLSLKNMGFTGETSVYVNGHHSSDRYYTSPGVVGLAEYLPRHMHFYPHRENFRTMQLFADLPNRELSVATQNGTRRLSLHERNLWMEDLTRRITDLPDSAFSFSAISRTAGKQGNHGKRIKQRVFKNDYRADSNDSIVRKRLQTLRINYVTDNMVRDGSLLPRMQYHRTVFSGYAEPEDFYSPDYSIEPLPMENDYRRTLYWNPAVTTNYEGEAVVEFYNNSTCTQLDISAEGITTDGKTMKTE